MGVGSSERRMEPRLPLTLAAHCQVGSAYVRSSVFDLSRTGLGLVTEEPWPPGTPVRVALALPHSEGPKFCTLAGKVVRAVAGAVGVQLDPDAGSAADRDVLQGFIALQRMRRSGAY